MDIGQVMVSGTVPQKGFEGAAHCRCQIVQIYVWLATQSLARKSMIYYAYLTELKQFSVDFWLAGQPVNQTHCRLIGLEWFHLI